MASQTPAPGPAPASAASPENCGDLRTVLRFPAHRSGVAAVRRKAREQLRSWGIPARVCDDAVLIVSELATNAIVHTASDTVTCHLGGGPEIYVEVGSDGRSAPRGTADPVGDSAGRGLLVVEALSSMCGISVPAPGAGWTAWATLDVPPADLDGLTADLTADLATDLVGPYADADPCRWGGAR